VLSDPSYTGERSLAGVPIAGLEQYRAGMESLWTLMVSGQAQEQGLCTQEELDMYQQAFDEAGEAFVGEIIDYCVEKYADERTVDAVGVDAETVKSSQGYQTAFAMWCWQFASGMNSDGLFCTLGDMEYDLETAPPTKSDFWALIKDTYGTDMSEQGIDYEKVPDGSSIQELLGQVIEQQYPQLLRMIATGESADSISGIEIIDEKTFSVTTTMLTDALENIIIVPEEDYPELEKGYVIPQLQAEGGSGAGKFTPESFTQGQLVLVPNENYFGTGASVDKLIYQVG
jgi:peptide/nickel transport system substrate-binding protein